MCALSIQSCWLGRSSSRIGLSCHGYSEDGLDYYQRLAGFRFSCDFIRRAECLESSSRPPEEGSPVSISYVQGQRCEATCQEKPCGCRTGLDVITPGDTYWAGDTLVTCTHQGALRFECGQPRLRKEIHDLTSVEWRRFHAAIRQLSSEVPSRLRKVVDLYTTHVGLVRGGPFYLPWLRYFVHQVESELQLINPSVTVPYFDWTVDAGALNTSQAWQANAFGGSGEESSQCVRRHPFQVNGVPSLPNRSGIVVFPRLATRVEGSHFPLSRFCHMMFVKP